MGREVVGIVAAWVCTLLGGWIAVSSFVFSSQPLGGEMLAVTRSNIAVGVVVLALAAVLGGLQVAALLAADRRRRGWQEAPVAERSARDGSRPPDPPAWPPAHGWSSPMREGPPEGAHQPVGADAAGGHPATDDAPSATREAAGPDDGSNHPEAGKDPAQGGSGLRIREHVRPDQAGREGPGT